MTWKEFKEKIETNGIKDEDEIFYIDTGNYPNAEKLNIGESNEGVEIWS